MVVMESEMQHRMPAWYDRYETSSGTVKKLRLSALCQKSRRKIPPYKDIHHHVMEKIYDISSEYAAKPFETKRLSKTRNLTKLNQKY